MEYYYSIEMRGKKTIFSMLNKGTQPTNTNLGKKKPAAKKKKKSTYSHSIIP